MPTKRLKSEKEYYTPHRTQRISQALFSKIEGSPISIYLNQFVVELFANLPKITEVLERHIGLHTRRFIAAIEGTDLARRFQKEGRNYYFQTGIAGRRMATLSKNRGEIKDTIEEAINWSQEAIKEYDIPRLLKNSRVLMLFSLSKGI